jgi:hypothetical protein
MLPALAHQWDALETRRQAFLAELAATSPAALAWRPAPDAWSLEDVAQHLWLVERGIVHVLDARWDKPPLKRGLLSPLTTPLMRLIVHRGYRIKAPVKEIVPKERMAVDAVRAEWDRTRATLHALLERTTPDREARKLFRHPILGAMSVGETAEFIWRHHDHHAHQVRRIRGAAGFPA